MSISEVYFLAQLDPEILCLQKSFCQGWGISLKTTFRKTFNNAIWGRNQLAIPSPPKIGTTRKLQTKHHVFPSDVFNVNMYHTGRF